MIRRLPLTLAFIVALCVPSISATQKYVGGYYSLTGTAAAAWTTLCNGTSDINSLASAASVQCNLVVANGTNQDLFMTISMSIAGTTASNQVNGSLAVAVYPKNQAGTYGENLFATQAAGTPTPVYAVNCTFYGPSASTAAFVGICPNIPIPAQDYKVVITNNLNQSGTGALNSTSNIAYIQTTNYQVAINDLPPLPGQHSNHIVVGVVEPASKVASR